MFYDWRQKLLYSTSPVKQLMTKLVRRYRAGKLVIYDETTSVQEAVPDFQNPDPEIYQPQLSELIDYEPIQYDFLPEANTPDFRLEPLSVLQPQISELEEQIISAEQEIQQAIDEVKEPENLEELLRPDLFPPIF